MGPYEQGVDRKIGASVMLRHGDIVNPPVNPPMSLLDHVPIAMVFIDAAGGVAFANSRSRVLLGLPPGEARPSAIIAAVTRLLGDDLLFDAAAAEIEIRSRCYRVEARPIAGPELWGRIWLFHDITTELAAPPERSDLPPHVKAAIDNLDEGVMLIDRNQHILLWNEAYLRMLDLPIKLFERGAELMPLIRALADRGDYGPGDPAVLADQIAANIRARKPAQGERQMVNGTIIAAEWICMDDGYFLFRLKNVTTERNASRFKDELIATVSHELRTPLTVISGALGLLRAGVGGQAEPRAAELIDVAHKNSERLTRLVNDLLDVDKLQSGTLDFRFERVDVALLLAASAEQNLPFAQGFGVAIDLDVPDEPVIVEVDRYRLLQVMSNLLSNAAKFSARDSRVRIRLRSSAAGVRISVVDHGQGMSAEFRRRLFTRFAQENRGSENGQAGTGLGLAICKSIIEKHHGRIIVDTREAIGTTFHVDLPYSQDTALIL